MKNKEEIMKKLFLFSILVCIFFAWTQGSDPAVNRFRERVLITIEKREDIAQLKEAKIEIERTESMLYGKVYAYAAPWEIDTIQRMGFSVEPAPETIGEDSPEIAYHTYETLTSDLQQMQSQYPGLAKLTSLGKSVQGREIWALKISDNVSEDEIEPEVKLVSTMHGDEVVGMEMLMYMARHLLENYNKDSVITTLVNEVEIWIIPNMNPDGTALKRRYNANYVDLNRNFPDPQDDPNNTPQGRAIETQHMMRFTAEHNFCLSLNFHGGALVVNYPWDTKPGDVPDIALTKFLSLGYSKLNPPMYRSPTFKNGITNGYAWYEVNGGMQDWNYHWYSDLDLTIEVSNIKWPNASTLPQYWEENRDSILWFITQSRRGIHGVITDADTHKPLHAQMEVLEIGKPTFSSPNQGDYHKVLMPGVYTVKFSAAGYEDTTYSPIEVFDQTQPIILNVSLKRK